MMTGRMSVHYMMTRLEGWKARRHPALPDNNDQSRIDSDRAGGFRYRKQ